LVFGFDSCNGEVYAIVNTTLCDRVSLCHILEGAFHQISVHLAKQFQRKRFLEIDQPETRIAYGSHVC
jgi:hypothetical protein